MWYALGIGRGHSQTLHRNYLLPISNNLGQVEDENSVVGVELIDKITPCHLQIMGGPESLPNSLPKKHKPVNTESTGSASPDPVNDGSQAGQDQPAPLRQSTCMTRNQLPWRYQNFTPQWNNTSPSAFDVWDGLHTCLHLMVGLYNAFGKSIVCRHSTWTSLDLSDTNKLWPWEGGIHQCGLYGGFLDGEEWAKGDLVQAQLSHHLKTKESAPHRESECLDSITPKAMYKVKQHSKHSTICNKVETLVHSTNATDLLNNKTISKNGNMAS